jgi:hypothetical protein
MDHFFENIHGWASFGDQGDLINLILDNLLVIDKIKIAEIGVYKGRVLALIQLLATLLHKNVKI